MPTKSQLRCLRVDVNNETGRVVGVGSINYIPAKDAVFVESRNLMVIIDNQGSLAVYSGLTKLCKLQLHNIMWSSQSSTGFAKKDLLHSPIITPIKSKLFQANVTKTMSIDEEITTAGQQNLFKTPKQSNASLFYKSILASNTGPAPLPPPPPPLLQQQHEFRAVTDATGARFTVKFNDGRLVRVHLVEPATCKLVNMYLEAFKYALNKEIYYELVQQWYIHRYSVGGESIRDQLNLFLYLVLSLCGCFDMGKLEQELGFLVIPGRGGKSKEPSVAKKLEELSEALGDTPGSKANLDNSIPYLADTSSCTTKRAKCNYDGTEVDWEFLLNDEMLNRNLAEFSSFDLKPKPKSAKKSRSLEPNETSFRGTFYQSKVKI